MQRSLIIILIAYFTTACYSQSEAIGDLCAIEVCYNSDTLRTAHAMDSAVMVRHPEFSSVKQTFEYLSTFKDCHIRYSGGDCPPGAIDLEMGSDSIGNYVAVRYSVTDGDLNPLALEYACLQRSIGHGIIGSFDIGQPYSEVFSLLAIDADKCPHDIYLKHPSGLVAQITFTDGRVSQILINPLPESSQEELYFREDGKYRQFFYF